MAHECLLGILQDLSAAEFEHFQWLLLKDSNGSIPKCRLETANRLQTVDVMTQTYPDRALEVTKKILEKIKRNDLVGRLSEAGSAWKGAAQQNVTQTQGANSAEKKLVAVRREFVQRVSEDNLGLLLDDLREMGVINDAEMESVRGEKLKLDKARKLIDMVRGKGNEASSQMIDAIRGVDAHLTKQLGL